MSEPSTADELSTEALEVFTSLPSDPTGTVTFERFRWQTKLAVRTWLTSLGPDGPVSVVTEHVEDLVVVETALLRFAQLKTRDKGSWSAKSITAPGHAISRLVKSYKLAKDVGIHTSSSFEAWLEGPQAEGKQTTNFFSDPTCADAEIKKRIRDFGIRSPALDDFLSRLVIRCYEPTRQSIDAVVLKLIGALWPHLSFLQVELLYERLLDMATTAQASAEPPAAMRGVLKTARAADMTLDATWAPIARQTLHRNQVRALCPPLGTDTNEDLLARVEAGHASMLELKLIRAGATAKTVAAAKGLRADSDIASKSARAAGRADDHVIQAIETRLLALARSTAALASSGVPGAPAEMIFHGLMGRPTDLLSTDPNKVFDGEARLVVGELCNLSDQCKFGWGVQ